MTFTRQRFKTLSAASGKPRAVVESFGSCCIAHSEVVPVPQDAASQFAPDIAEADETDFHGRNLP